MISLIICSRQPDIPQELKDNIALTIGVEYELVVIDNSKNQYSIFQAYNEGVRRAKYPLLCFMHEDILYHTQDWGTKVVEHFKDDKVGMIGVYGGHYIPNVSTWAFTFICSGTLIQGNRTSYQKRQYDVQSIKSDKYIKEKDNKVQVVAVDGLWFCIPKLVFDYICFDHQTYNGFHAYDLDISMQVNKAGFTVYTIFDILIEHFSLGNYDNQFLTAINIFHQKWNSHLPIVKGIVLSETEKNERAEFAMMSLYNRIETDGLKMELNRVKNTNSYRLGKFILKPFVLIRRIMNNKRL